MSARSLHLGLGLKLALRDREPISDLLDRDLGRGADALGVVSCASELARKGHAEAASVGCADQFLRIGALPLCKPGGKRVIPLEGAASELHCALPLAQAASPLGFCNSCWHTSSSYSCFVAFIPIPRTVLSWWRHLSCIVDPLFDIRWPAVIGLHPRSPDLELSKLCHRFGGACFRSGKRQL